MSVEDAQSYTFGCQTVALLDVWVSNLSKLQPICVERGLVGVELEYSST